jgi:hypothetical protein
MTLGRPLVSPGFAGCMGWEIGANAWLAHVAWPRCRSGLASDHAGELQSRAGVVRFSKNGGLSCLDET